MLRDADYCARKLSQLKAGDVVGVGKTRWRIWRNRGVTNFVEKDGSKGKRLYTLHAVSLDPCCIEVRRVFPGTGDQMPNEPVAAKGCTTSVESAWAGARRR